MPTAVEARQDGALAADDPLLIPGFGGTLTGRQPDANVPPRDLSGVLDLCRRIEPARPVGLRCRGFAVSGCDDDEGRECHAYRDDPRRTTSTSSVTENASDQIASIRGTPRLLGQQIVQQRWVSRLRSQAGEGTRREASHPVGRDVEDLGDLLVRHRLVPAQHEDRSLERRQRLQGGAARSRWTSMIDRCCADTTVDQQQLRRSGGFRDRSAVVREPVTAYQQPSDMLLWTVHAPEVIPVREHAGHQQPVHLVRCLGGAAVEEARQLE